jgi:hypothetical protein
MHLSHFVWNKCKKRAVLYGVCGAAAIVLLYTILGAPIHPLWRTWATSDECVAVSGQESSPHHSIHGVTGCLFNGSVFRKYPARKQMRLFEEEGMAGSLRRPPSSLQNALVCDSWGVITTIHRTAALAIERVAEQKDWCVVVVGDKKTPPLSFSPESPVVFLDVATQRAMMVDGGDRNRLGHLLPWNHFGRKNLGYLYALQHGAKRVWDFDDDNVLLLLQGEGLTMPGKTARLETSCLVFNVYPIMGAPGSPCWPRGFPLELIKRKCVYGLVVEQHPDDDTTVAVVLQSLANHDPDVDAIYRLTQRLPFSFEVPHHLRGRTVVLPQGTFSPLNAQATMFLQPALWSLLLPITVHGRVSDIWRSYFAQRLLWDIGLAVGFISPRVVQERNPHNFLADMDAEHDLYMRSLAMVQFLREWKGRSPSLPDRMEELAIALYERGYWEIRDVELMQQWIIALWRAGYHFPPVIQEHR